MTANLENTSTQLSPVLVGREKALGLLRQRLDATLEGNGSTVLVAGETGAGKTRLLDEVEREAGKRDLLFLRGSGDPLRSGLAYGLCLDVMSTYLQHGSRRQVRNLRDMVEELAPHLRDELFPRARSHRRTSAADMNPELRQALFLARLTRLLLEMAGQRPLVLCLDDLHHADSASLQLLRYLASKNEEVPLLIIGAYCPEAAREEGTAEVERTVLELYRNPDFELLNLERLAAGDTETLVESCFEHAVFDGDLLDLIQRKSGGVPLFIVQYLEFLRQQGVLYEHRGVWLNRPVEESDVPESVRAILQRRIQSLSGDERLMLSHAAVQGEHFSGGLVAQVMGWPQIKLLRLLNRLERTTHLVCRSERGFRFAHPLFVEIFYKLLSGERRRVAHLRLGNMLEQQRPEAVESLAFHFYRAESFARALPYLQEAGARAAAVSAYREVRHFMLQALDASERLEAPEGRGHQLQVLLDLAVAENRLGQWNSTNELCLKVLRISDPDQDQAAVGNALLQLGEIRSQKGEFAEAAHFCREALEVFAELGDEEGRAQVYTRLGCMALERSLLEEAREHFAAARTIALQSGKDSLLGAIYRHLGFVSTVRGHYVEAVVHYTRAMQACRAAGDRYGVCQIYYNLGRTHAAQQEWEAARACYTQAVKWARKMGAVELLGPLLVHRGCACSGAGNAAAAEVSCVAARVYFQQIQDRQGLAECDKVEGMICREQTRYPAAKELLQHGRYMFQDLGNRLGLAKTERQLGLLSQNTGEPEAARQHLNASLELFEQIGAIDEALKTEELLAVLAI